jgi:adenylate cyclase
VATGVEIERKFLVDAVPDDIPWDAEEHLRQGYLALDGDTEVRLRRADRGSRLTIKHGSGMRRVEEELELEERQADTLWGLTEGRRLEKRRLRTGIDGGVLELDIYEGDLAGLVVAEVEFASEDAANAFRPPAWLGREVTQDAAYKNRALACDGAPTQEGTHP